MTPDTASHTASRFQALDLLSLLVAVLQSDGAVQFANAALENVLGLSRRSVQRGSLFEWFVDAATLRDTIAAVSRNDFSTSRLEALLRQPIPATPSRCRCM